MAEVAGYDVPGYVLGKRLGQGSFGVVYRARRIADDAECAVKVANPRRGRKAAIEEEIAVLRAVVRGAPGCVPMFLGAGKVRDQLNRQRVWMATELFDRGDLYQVMVRRRDQGQPDNTLFSDREVMRVAATVLTVLMSLPFGFRVHGDIKPDNILMSANGTFRLTDMGSSALMGKRAHHYIGTPGYVPPECLMFADFVLDRSVDVWMLGATLYELATGKLMVDMEVRDEFRYLEQLAHVAGPPPAAMLSDPTRLRWDARQLFVASAVGGQTPDAGTMDRHLSGRHDRVQPFIHKCCMWSPAARCGVGELYKLAIDQ